jgi:hypothetical protein
MKIWPIHGYYSIIIKVITIIIVAFVVVVAALFTWHMCLRFICGVQK